MKVCGTAQQLCTVCLFGGNRANDSQVEAMINIRAQCIYISVKHTANILRTARYTPIGMGMVVMQLGASHADVAWLGPLRGCSHRVRPRSYPCSSTWTTGPTWTCHMGGMTCLHVFAIVDFGHSPDSSATQSWILVAISPAIHCSLDQPSLPSQARVQVSECPAHRIALGLVDKAIATVLILLATRTGVHAILRFEFCSQAIDID